MKHLFNISTITALLIICASNLLSKTAYAADRKEWNSVILSFEKRSAKAAELAEKSSLSQNDKCYIERVLWDRSENGDYLPSIGSAKSDRDRINRLDEQLGKTWNKYKSKGLKCNQLDDAGAPIVVLSDNNSSATEPKTPSATSGKRLFGQWKAVACDYFRDNQRISDQLCALKKEWNINFSAGKMVSNGTESTVEYTDLPELVDVRDLNGNLSRYFVGNNGSDIVLLINEPASRRTTTVRFVRATPVDIQPKSIDLGFGTAEDKSPTRLSNKGIILESVFYKFALPDDSDYTANDWNDIQKIQGIRWAKDGLKMNSTGFVMIGDVTLARHGKADVFFTGARTMVLEGTFSVGEVGGKIFEKDQFDSMIKNQFTNETKIRKMRGGCSDEGALSGDAIYEVMLKGKKPVYVLAMTDAGGNTPNSRTSSFSFSLKNEQRWQCRH